MHETADQFVQHLFDLYGPIAVFGLLVIAGVGLHLPEDLIIIPAGWEIAAGKFPMFWTVLAAYLGVTGGDTLWFLVCRRFGGRLVGTHWFRKQAHPKRILQVKALYDRHGTWVLLVSRFIPGSRTVGVASATSSSIRSICCGRFQARSRSGACSRSTRAGWRVTAESSA
ncbi:MAG: hypothetical protein GY704_07850 [Phycisphaeraceae bacterium]|nr:hypothetical protein [Phycisphaeraceae bacterium]